MSVPVGTPITLDGNTYYIEGVKIGHTQVKVGSTRRTVTGDLLRQESATYIHAYTYTLLIDLTSYANLKASFNKVAPNNLLNFVDVEGFNWNPAAGTNDATHAYNTGVYFTKKGAAVPKTEAGWISSNLFTVDVELLPNAKGASS